MTMLERYSLAQKLHIQEWEKSCLTTLITRPARLTIDEGDQLGMKAVIFISALREEGLARSPRTNRCTECGPTMGIGAQNVDASFVEQRIKEWLDSGC
jgi:hypothetical protein